MFYSLVGLIQPAETENRANQNICEMTEIFRELELFDSWVWSGIFETEDIDNFMEQFKENIKQFFKDYEEKCKNVQNN